MNRKPESSFSDICRECYAALSPDPTSFGSGTVCEFDALGSVVRVWPAALCGDGSASVEVKSCLVNWSSAVTSFLGSIVDAQYYMLWVCNIVIHKFFFKNYLFIYLFLAVLGLHCCAGFFSSRGKRELPCTCGFWASHCSVCSCCRAQVQQLCYNGLSCSAVCGIFPDEGSNPCLLHWQADSLPLSHQGNLWLTSVKGYTPFIVIIKWWLCSLCYNMFVAYLFYTEKFVSLNPLPLSCPSLCPLPNGNHLFVLCIYESSWWLSPWIQFIEC